MFLLIKLSSSVFVRELFEKKEKIHLIDLSLGDLTKIGEAGQSLSDSFTTILINEWVCFYFKSTTVQ